MRPRAPAPSAVLFVCVENACRSLMAEAMFNARPPPGWMSNSAGTRPSAHPNPRTGPFLAELGLSLPPHPPQPLTPELLSRARLVITLGCLDDASCPAYLRIAESRDWGLPDPAKMDDAGFREVRNRLVALVERLREELASRATARSA